MSNATTYGCQFRPPAFGGSPQGFSAFGTHPAFPNGTVTYPEPLPLEQASHFGLLLIPSESDLSDFVAKVAAGVEYRDSWLEMIDSDGPGVFEPSVGTEIERACIWADRSQVTERVIAAMRAL